MRVISSSGSGAVVSEAASEVIFATGAVVYSLYVERKAHPVNNRIVTRKRLPNLVRITAFPPSPDFYTL